MWAQLITGRLKPGKEDELATLSDQLRATEQPGSGLVRSTSMQDQRDRRNVYTLVVFESEERARERERDPRRQEALEAVRATMADLFEGPLQFVDLLVVAETAG